MACRLRLTEAQQEECSICEICQVAEEDNERESVVRVCEGDVRSDE